MPTKYKWPDGQFYDKPFKRKQPATGLLKLIKRLRYLPVIWKHIDVQVHFEGDRSVGCTSGIDLVKMPEWQKKKGNTNRRIASTKETKN